MDFVKNPAKVVFDPNAKPLMIPTTAGSFDKLQEQAAEIVDKIDKIPFEAIGNNLNSTLAGLSATLKQVNGKTLPELDTTMKGVQKTVSTAGDALSGDSPLQQNLGTMLQEVQRTARSLRVLVDYLVTVAREQAMIRPGLIRRGRSLPGAAVVLALAACASAPLHYYTLVAPATDATNSGATAAAATGNLPFQLLPVTVPSQVDQPQLVVRQGGQSVSLLNGERWIAPLADEVRSALSTDLARQLHSEDVSALPGNDSPLLRIKLDVRRFDSQPGSYALIDGTWSVRVMHGASGQGSTVSCSSRISETVGPGYDALVEGHQRAIGRLAAQIAGAAQSLGNGQTPTCPAS
ncbi:MAG: hypothetical protein WDW38_011453 [Sanguina aurantia]